jgi:opacity protein-like surface antigen
MVRRAALGLVLAALGIGAAQAATEGPDAVLRSLIGKNETAIERRMGVPDATERNGVQTFLTYHNDDFWRKTSRPYPPGYSQGYSGALGFRNQANFECETTLVLTDGVLRAYTRRGTGCR